jgi:hypothetical protein
MPLIHPYVKGKVLASGPTRGNGKNTAMSTRRLRRDEAPCYRDPLRLRYMTLYMHSLLSLSVLFHRKDVLAVTSPLLQLEDVT